MHFSLRFQITRSNEVQATPGAWNIIKQQQITTAYLRSSIHPSIMYIQTGFQWLHLSGYIPHTHIPILDQRHVFLASKRFLAQSDSSPMFP